MSLRSANAAEALPRFIPPERRKDYPIVIQAPGGGGGGGGGGGSSTTIFPGQSIQDAVNNNPPGTTFLIKAGTHRNQSVIPKSGDVFVGEPGAILDGSNSTPYAFWKGSALPWPSNVRIEGLVIQNYAPPVQFGAITAGEPTDDPSRHATGWVVRNCEVRYTVVGEGIRVGHKMQVLNNYIHHNDHLGIGGAGDSILVEGNEIAFNNYLKHYTWGWELGGMKVLYTRWLIVRGNYAHDNWGPGFWTDRDNIYTLYENNRVENNGAAGILHEVSYDAVIRKNVTTNNGYAKGWIQGGGILIAASPNVEIYENVASGNKMGIDAIQQGRTPGAYGPHQVQNLYVHDNTITTSGQTGIASDIADNAIYTSWNNRFRHNTYHLGSNQRPFFWLNAPRSVDEWRSYGQDPDGIFLP